MKRIALFSLLLAAACGSGIDQKSKPPLVINSGQDMGTDDSGGGGGEDMDVMVPDATFTPGGPQIIQLSSNVTRLTEGESITLSALVTDDDGLDDIVGGLLLSGETTYGNFQGTGGSYQFDLSWSAINQVAPINFATQSTLVLTAEFVDTMGNRGTQSLTITLHCGGEAACEGSCSDQQCDGACRDASYFEFDDTNCGQCGNSCGAGQFCEGGACFCDGDICNGECTDRSSDRNNCGTCGNVCGATEECIFASCEFRPEAMSPCQSPDDCPVDGDCFTEFPGGVCIVQCQSNSDCGSGEVCVTPSTFPITLCAPTCNSSNDCRDGLECQMSQEGVMGCGPVLGN